MPRTSTFGKIGVSNGQFFDAHLAKIHESHQWINWKTFDISSLTHDTFDATFISRVSNLPRISVTTIPILNEQFVKELKKDVDAVDNAVVIIYKTKPEYVNAAKRLQIMDDLKAGVPRGGYRGVVSTIYNNVQVYLSPQDPATWVYPTTW